MKNGIRSTIALSIIFLYIIVTIVLLAYNLFSSSGDMYHFFDQMGKANFLLGPVGFIIGFYFGKDNGDGK